MLSFRVSSQAKIIMKYIHFYYSQVKYRYIYYGGFCCNFNRETNSMKHTYVWCMLERCAALTFVDLCGVGKLVCHLYLSWLCGLLWWNKLCYNYDLVYERKQDIFLVFHLDTQCQFLVFLASKLWNSCAAMYMQYQLEYQIVTRCIGITKYYLLMKL